MNTLALTMMKHKRLISIMVMTVFVAISLMSIAFGTDTAAIKALKDKLEKIAGTVRGFGAVVCIVCAVYIGIMFILSSVNPKLRDQAKGALWGILIGVIVLVLADQVAKVIVGLTGANSDIIEQTQDIK